MVTVEIYHPEHPAVAAALAALEAANLAAHDHVLDCGTCKMHNPFRYRNCEAGHQLAAAVLARRFDAVNADAAASTPGPGLGPLRRPRAAAGE